MNDIGTNGIGMNGFGMSGFGMNGLGAGRFGVDPRFRNADLSAMERRLNPYARSTAADGSTPGSGARAAAKADGPSEPAGAKGPTPIDRRGRLFQACQDFEALFIKQMLSSMRKTIHKTGLLDGGMAEEIFEDMLYDEYALKMARTAGFGLSETLYRELSRNPAVRSRSL